MSSYTRMTKNPKSGEFEQAEWLDDYFGSHQYGVRFPDGSVVEPDFQKNLPETREFTAEERLVQVEKQLSQALKELNEWRRAYEQMKTKNAGVSSILRQFKSLLDEVDEAL